MTNFEEIRKRRTFAIISHPDAGKTTLTEKLLLYGGAINLAGSVKGRKTGKHSLLLRFEARGTRYEGRTEQIESVHVGDSLKIVREPDNSFNANNFRILTAQGRNVGNMPAELCNVIAPLFDEGSLLIDSAAVSFVEPISRRSRHAKQAILFVEMHCRWKA